MSLAIDQLARDMGFGVLLQMKHIISKFQHILVRRLKN